MSDEQRPLDATLDRRLRQEGAEVRALRAGCPPPELLLARGAEALAAETRSHLDAHLTACGACRRLADDLECLDLGSADAHTQARVLARVPGEAGRQRVGSLIAIAAGLALACGLAMQSMFQRAPSAVVANADAVSTPRDAQRAPATELAALWNVSAPPFRLPLSSLDQVRGAEQTAASSFVAASRAYQEGNYQQAGERLAEIVTTWPSSGDAQFYLGVSRLLAGQPRDAIGPLNTARTLLPPSRSREVDWYLATALQRAGDDDRARERLDTLCRDEGPHRDDACAAGARLR